MKLSVITLPHQQPQFFAQCPVTGQHVAVRDLREFDLINRQAMWWRCMECGGWHVALKPDESEQAAVEEVVSVS